MKNKTKIIKLILIIILINLFMIIFCFKQISNRTQSDDFLFLKLFHGQSKTAEEEYSFKVNYLNKDLKTVNLSDTINKNFYKKVAPGTNGKFNIVLNSTRDLQYQVKFSSTSAKPQNLKFMALTNGEKITKASELEELSENLKGIILKNQKVSITVLWYWPYEGENQEEQVDIQDTIDGKNIEKYKFDILVLGEEV